MSEPPSAWERACNPTAAARWYTARRNGQPIAPCGCTDTGDHEAHCTARLAGYPAYYGDTAWAHYREDTA